ncbi:SCP2 domain-containing protein [Motiliproteus sp. SC1-56]|uniref:ubiquinone biosynthesis accessory factor UbiJ n=1 Tax=Motiliproteus sp. SC1-56 TaxID=2799565 RepID=UPI001A8DDF13|nr:SCP2 sterol-binding domain-containing protein [Motiliproteus sp. SC1-56]
MDFLNAGLNVPLEVAIRAAVRRDPRAQKRLASLEGRRIRVDLRVPALSLVLAPHGEGIDLSSPGEEAVDCTLEGGVADLLQVLMDENKAFGKGIRISGDSQLALDLKRCLQELDLDWEGFLGDHLGDLAAHSLAGLVRDGLDWGRRSRESLLDDLDNYLHEELRTLPPREELNGFYSQVDRLRLAADRLQARVQRLQSSVHPVTEDAGS